MRIDMDVPDRGFQNCEAEVLHVGFGVRRIGEFAFVGCPNLREIHFEEGIEVIGRSAFRECNVLEGVCLPGSLKLIEPGAFAACRVLANVEVVQDGQEPLVLNGACFSDCALDRDKLLQRVADINRKRAEKLAAATLAARRDFFERLFACATGTNGAEVENVCQRHREAALQFANVTDWNAADQELLRNLLYVQENHIANVGQGNMNFHGIHWPLSRERECRQRCQDLVMAARDGDIDRIETCSAVLKDWFYVQYGCRFPSVVNRVVAGVASSAFATIVDASKLARVGRWLGNQMTQQDCEAHWAANSHLVKDCLRTYLPGVDDAELNVFLWYLAEALDQANASERDLAMRELIAAEGQ